MASALVAIAWAATNSVAIANPAGGVAVVGSMTTSTQGNKLTVTTQNGAGTNHSAINWQSFSIPQGSSTYFQQPSSSSAVINRVVTNTPSQLFGTLGSNGHLVLVNQAGITVGAGAVVDTAGFTASALKMTDADALAARMRFGDGTLGGAVSVQGQVLARSGDVVLIGSNVDTGKDALIQAPNGSTVLAAGNQVEITGRGLEGISMTVQAPENNAVNLGTLKGDAVGIFAGTLKHSGVVQATRATLEGGKVVLKAAGDAIVEGAATITATGTTGGSVDVLGKRVGLTDTASIDVSGTQGGGQVRVGGDYQGKNTAVPNAEFAYLGKDVSIKANATDKGNGGRVIVWADDTTRAYGSIEAKGGVNGGDGGFVETSGKRALITDGVRVNASSPKGAAGTWLLDPFDLTIGTGTENVGPPSGGLFDAAALGSVLNASTIEAALGDFNNISNGTNISVQSGLITVNSAINWSSNLALSLKATGGNIVVNAPISATGANAYLTLSAAGSISNSGTGLLSVSGLALSSGGSVNLTGANQVAFLAATGSTTGFFFENAKSTGLTLKGVGSMYGATASAGNFYIKQTAGNITTQSIGGGVTASGGLITLEATAGDIALGSYFSNSTGGVKLVAGGAVADSADANISTNSLEVIAGAAVTLNSPYSGHAVDNVAVSAGGDISVKSSAATLTVKTVGATAGVVSTGGNVNLQAANGHLTVQQQVKATGSGKEVQLAADKNVFDVGTSSYIYSGELTIDNAVVEATDVKLTAGTKIEQIGAGGNIKSTGNTVLKLQGQNGNIDIRKSGNDFTNISRESNSQDAANIYLYDSNGITVGELRAQNQIKVEAVGSILNYDQYSKFELTGGNSTDTIELKGSALGATGTGGYLVMNPGSSGLVKLEATSGSIFVSGYSQSTMETSRYSVKATGVGQVVNLSGQTLNVDGDLSGWLVSDDTVRFGTYHDGESLGALTVTATGLTAAEVKFAPGAYLGPAAVTFTGASINAPVNIGPDSNTADLTVTGSLNAGSHRITFAPTKSLTADAFSITGSGGWRLMVPDQSSCSGCSYTLPNNNAAADFHQFNYSNGDAVLGTGNGILQYGTTQMSSPIFGGTWSREYDGTTSFSLTSTTVTNVSGSLTTAGFTYTPPSSTAALTGTASFLNKNVGTSKTLDFGGSSVKFAPIVVGTTTLYGLKADVSSSPPTADITAKALTISGITAAGKTYDGNSTASVSTSGVTSTVLQSGGMVAGDSITVSATGNFRNAGNTANDKNVGTAKTVQLSSTYGGADLGNYTIADQATTTADITAKALTVTGTTVQAREFNNNATATLIGGTLVGVLGSDAVTLTQAGTFDNKNAGTGKAVTANDSISGTDAGNYTITQPTGLTGSITAKSSHQFIGASGGYWSVAANWDGGFVPETGNVLSVFIPATDSTSNPMVARYDISSLSLNSINSDGTFKLESGALNVSSGLRTLKYEQVGGSLNGTGTVTVDQLFNKSGGNIDVSGKVKITQASGDLVVADVRAPTMQLTALNGSVSYTNTGATTAIVFEDTNGATGITIDNRGGVTLAGATRSVSGGVSATARSPLVVTGSGIQAAGNVSLTTTNQTSAGTMTINAPVTSTGGGLTMSASGAYTQNSALSAAGGVSVSAASVSYGAGATTDGNPVSYTVGGVSVAAPISKAAASSSVQAGSIVSDFLEKLDEALDEQVALGTTEDEEEKRRRAELEGQGEICLR